MNFNSFSTLLLAAAAAERRSPTIELSSKNGAGGRKSESERHSFLSFLRALCSMKNNVVPPPPPALWKLSFTLVQSSARHKKNIFSSRRNANRRRRSDEKSSSSTFFIAIFLFFLFAFLHSLLSLCALTIAHKNQQRIWKAKRNSIVSGKEEKCKKTSSLSGKTSSECAPQSVECLRIVSCGFSVLAWWWKIIASSDNSMWESEFSLWRFCENLTILLGFFSRSND